MVSYRKLLTNKYILLLYLYHNGFVRSNKRKETGNLENNVGL